MKFENRIQVLKDYKLCKQVKNEFEQLLYLCIVDIRGRLHRILEIRSKELLRLVRFEVSGIFFTFRYRILLSGLSILLKSITISWMNDS